MTERVVRAPDVLWRRTFDRVILLGLDDREVRTLLGTGVEVWDLLSAPHSVGALSAALAERYRADPEVVRSDLATLIEQLLTAGAVVRVP